MKRRCVLVAVTGLCLLIGASGVSAVPPIPSTFSGIITVDGGHVRLSSMVTATIDGVWTRQVPVIYYEGSYWYYISVMGDDPDSPSVVEGGKPGDVVTFQVDGLRAVETGIWAEGGAIRLDLHVRPRHLFLPIVRHGPDPASEAVAP